MKNISFHQLMNDPAFKLFSKEGLQNIIGNFISPITFNKLIGETSKEKAENLHHSFLSYDPKSTVRNYLK